MVRKDIIILYLCQRCGIFCFAIYLFFLIKNIKRYMQNNGFVVKKGERAFIIVINMVS